MALLAHRDGDILTIRSVGDQTMTEGLRQMEAALDLARAHHAAAGVRCHLLFDMRESEENKDPDELRDVTMYLAGNLDVLTGRIAVIVERGLLFGLARMFAVYGENVGLNTGVFTGGEAARRWLHRGRAAANLGEA